MEILFKGKLFERNEWIKGDLIHDAFDGIESFNVGIKSPGLYLERIRKETICQFTGLYDATKWHELTEDQRDKWTLDGNIPSEWKGLMLFSDDVISDGTRTLRIYMTEGGFVLKSYYWCSDVTDLTPSDELILQPLPDMQTRSWIESSCVRVGNIHDKE